VLLEAQVVFPDSTPEASITYPAPSAFALSGNGDRLWATRPVFNETLVQVRVYPRLTGGVPRESSVFVVQLKCNSEMALPVIDAASPKTYVVVYGFFLSVAWATTKLEGRFFENFHLMIPKDGPATHRSRSRKGSECDFQPQQEFR
jgi:hypothetical protein